MIYAYVNSPVIYFVLAIESTCMRCSRKTGPVCGFSAKGVTTEISLKKKGFSKKIRNLKKLK